MRNTSPKFHTKISTADVCTEGQGPCTSCALAVETGAVRLTSGLGTDGTTRTANTSTIVFTAYTYFSETVILGLCETVAGTSTLATAYVVTAAATVSDPNFPASATSGFLDFLGFSSCYGTVVAPGETNSVTIPGQPLGTGSSTGSDLSINAFNIAEAPIGSPTTGTSPWPTGTALAVGLSVGSVLIALCLVLLLWRYRRNKRSKIISSNDKDPSITVDEDRQPYLQRKGELDAHENSKFELSAEQRQYELEGDTEIHEMPTGANARELSGCGRTELRGEEHSKEMVA
ncbi:MAG: hypothetical protein Q9180_004319 [Flavoplaca navasiana]